MGAPTDLDAGPARRLNGRISSSNVPFAEELWAVGAVAHRSRLNLIAGAGLNLQHQEVGFLQELARLVLAEPLGHNDIGFKSPDE